MPLDSTKSPIGWKWKSINMETYEYTVADSTAFFVKSRSNDINKLVFTKFEGGQTTGKIVFDKSAVSMAGIPGIISRPAELSVFPNPVKDQLNIVLGDKVNGTVQVSVFDLTGRQVFSVNQETSGNTLSLDLPKSALGNGMHLLKVDTGNGVFTSKFMVAKY
jgi:hypothetical protein